MAKAFEEIEVWQLASILVRDIYKYTYLVYYQSSNARIGIINIELYFLIGVIELKK